MSLTILLHEVILQKTRQSMTKRCFSALQNRSNETTCRKGFQKKQCYDSMQCMWKCRFAQVHLLPQLVHQAASVWCLKAHLLEELFPRSPGVPLSVLYFSEALSDFRVGLFLHLRLSCFLGAHLSFAASCLHKNLTRMSDVTQRPYPTRAERQVGFVGKNDDVLLDRASKARVDALDL